MTNDLRNFRYAFEPLLHREQWALEALGARIGAKQREIDLEDEALRIRRADFAGQAARLDAGTIDPVVRLRTVRWLGREQAEIDRRQRRREALDAQQNALRAEQARVAGRVEVLKRHRDEAMAEHRCGTLRLAAAAADDDWLGRARRARSAEAA
ncbi:hypothetical protein [Ramlibacter sp.]|uniref:hypothetical protein n=1 Tax=Ramlibacter sp. TaxID=1917967 RepID=UPI003D0E6B6A